MGIEMIKFLSLSPHLAWHHTIRFSPQNPLNDENDDVFVNTFIHYLKWKLLSGNQILMSQIVINFQWGKSICYSIKSYISQFFFSMSGHDRTASVFYYQFGGEKIFYELFYRPSSLCCYLQFVLNMSIIRSVSLI